MGSGSEAVPQRVIASSVAGMSRADNLPLLAFIRARSAAASAFVRTPRVIKRACTMATALRSFVPGPLMLVTLPPPWTYSSTRCTAGNPPTSWLATRFPATC